MEPITALYVPGDRPDRFDKAAASGADLVILDLEDAVAAERKAEARAAVVDWLDRAPTDLRLQVRVNEDFADDLAALSVVARPFELRMPKVDSAGSLDALADAAGRHPVTALIESALGVENAVEIARHPVVAHLGLGESDLASELGSRHPMLIDHARVRLLFAARAAGLPAPMLSVYPGIRDVDGLRADTERGRELGWFGRSAVHPSQLAVIAAVFRTSPDDERWAHEVLAVTAAGGVGVLSSGEMVDPAMIGRARAILARPRAS